MTFLEKLISDGIINVENTKEILARASKKYGGEVDPVLVEMGISADDILKLKGDFFNIPSRKIVQKSVNPELLKFIPEESAEHYKIVPIGMTDNVLEVGIVDPENSEAASALQFIFSQKGTPFKLFLISRADFETLFNAYRGTVSTGQNKVYMAVEDLDADGTGSGTLTFEPPLRSDVANDVALIYDNVDFTVVSV